ncbi:hypothetical protein GCM10007862_08690 [Dyella lipolytica]|uniref:Phage tail protein (Tail_P2_I) n=1 Tax=Dyella lipolytica TaxID=1867835 RepID=A0ABW8IZW9_9GAMM|nr:hypothetical protein [Dyella lipolytica]GLQ45818.1 hypothetical protein GCM10007862_08690 [Dyella lipolytica]
MSLDAAGLFALLPAVYRTRDATNGGPLQALFEVLATQSGIVEENIEQLYDDQFIETCMPWVIPYIGDLIGYNSIYQTAAGLDSRAEVANTIGYRRRKGTPIALQQVAMDVSGRAAVVVEEFRRLITTQSMRLPRPHLAECLNLRRSAVMDSLSDLAFDQSNRTVDVRRIAPRIRDVQDPDPAPLDIALHGPGRFNIPDIAVHLWRWQPWTINQAPAFVVDARRFKFNPIGLDIPLFSLPPTSYLPFTHINTRLDVPQPIRRGEFRRELSDFYGQSMMLYADNAAIPATQICCANLADRPGGSWCKVQAGKIAIDPELGRIQYADDLTPPQSLSVTYNYGFPAAIGGGPYDRTASLGQEVPTQNPALANFFAQVGTPTFPDLATAIAQWNLQPAGSTGIIVLTGFERYAIDLTGANAITLASDSTLAIAAAVPVPLGGPRDMTWNNACVTLLGNIDVIGLPPPPMSEGEIPPIGQLIINGLLIEGQLTITGSAVAVQLSDCTLVPGLGAANPGLSPCEPSVIVENDATLCIARCIAGPIAASAAGSVRVCNSIVDANSPCCVAYSGADGYSAGADLHVEDSTIVGKVRTRTMRLASNTIFFARLGKHDPWPAALWCSRRQVGCVRFCSLPSPAITPRCYECLPPDADSAAKFAPHFITLRYGHPSYALLSGDVPMAVWRGADNGSQMGVYYQIEETEAVSNVQIRTPEYLPVMLEAGIFLHPSQPLPSPVLPPFGYYYGVRPRTCCGDEDDSAQTVFHGIGVELL